ncbi:MAG: 2-dehydropantoate 2-reductase N-terminal domain-containing protein [Alphaproteobacteria bacterium]
MFFKKKTKEQQEPETKQEETPAIKLKSFEEIKKNMLEEMKKLPTEKEVEITIEEHLEETKNEDEDQGTIEEVETKEDPIASEEPKKSKTVQTQKVEDEKISEEEKNRKIYILGDNALACFFAMRFSNSGEKVVLITNKGTASRLSNNGVTIIENHSLQKNHYKFDTTFWLKEAPKMLIITSDAIKLNASLTAISRKKIVNSPVLLFTPIKDTLYIRNILENDIYRSFFDGYLLSQSDQVLLYGRNPSISFTPKSKKKNDKIISSCFEKAGLSVKSESTEEKAFWDFFSVHAICSLVSAAYNKNIFDVIKDKEKREKLIPLINEITQITKHDGVELNSEEVLKKIYNTPLSYPYPLQVEISKGKAGDFNLISSNLSEIANRSKCKIDELNSLLKKIYNIIMA